jgi:hypothetical protein
MKTQCRSVPISLYSGIESNMILICGSGTTTASIPRQQQMALARVFGCARVVYNDALRARRQAHDAGLPYISAPSG